jgi:integrase/recombinase XerD
MPTFTDPESVEWYRYPVLAENPHGKQWIKSEALLGLAPRTIDAYARGVNDFLAFCQRTGVDLLTHGIRNVYDFPSSSPRARWPHRNGRVFCRGSRMANQGTRSQRLKYNGAEKEVVCFS